MTEVELELMKLLLGIDSSDNTLDGILNIYLDRAQAIILGYCNTESLDEKYNNVIVQYSVYLYRNRDSEGLLKKSEGERSITYEEGIPSVIKLQLPLPRIKAVGYVL